MSFNQIMKLGKKANSASLHQLLWISCGFSLFLLMARVVLTGNYFYFFLPWNLFLAFIPYWVSAEIIKLPLKQAASKFIFLLLFIVIILFIPNSFYIITDLFHLRFENAAPAWFDLILIFSYAWNGILCGIISLNRLEHIITRKIGKEYSVFIIFLVMSLSAFGIYIGRYLRYNSWDLILNPFSLLEEIINMMIHPLQNKFIWGMTICYATVMSFVYLTIKKFSELIIVASQGGTLQKNR